MTREEAIKVIDGRFEIMDYCESARLEEALDIAVESLKQPQPRRMDDFFKTHELYPEKREGWYRIWKCRKKPKEDES